jgi:hypothetical protein
VIDLPSAVIGVSYLVAIAFAARWTIVSLVAAVRLRRRLYPDGLRIVVRNRPSSSTRGGRGTSVPFPERHQASMPGPRSIVRANGSGRRS